MGQVARNLENQHNDGLYPELKRLGEKYKLGTPLGGQTVSDLVMRVCLIHQECLTGGAGYVNGLMTTAGNVVAAIRTAQSNYTSADFASAETSQVVASLLSQALGSAAPSGGTPTGNSVPV